MWLVFIISYIYRYIIQIDYIRLLSVIFNAERFMGNLISCLIRPILEIGNLFLTPSKCIIINTERLINHKKKIVNFPDNMLDVSV